MARRRLLAGVGGVRPRAGKSPSGKRARSLLGWVGISSELWSYQVAAGAPR